MTLYQCFGVCLLASPLWALALVVGWRKARAYWQWLIDERVIE